MKKLLALVLVLCLSLSVAAAETAVISQQEFEAEGLQLNSYAGTFIQTLPDPDRTWMFQVVDAELNPLSDTYPKIECDGACYEVQKDFHECGLLDGNGKELIPAEYLAVEALSNEKGVKDGRWAIGIRAKEGSSGNYDYKTMVGPRSSGQKFYLIDTIDVYFRGEKKGTLTRDDWDYANVYGDYLSVRNREGIFVNYDKDLFRTKGTEGNYGEYTKDYDTNEIIHNGSGQQAFCPECTLTEEEVDQCLWLNDEQQLLDLQGNVLADFSGYTGASVQGCGLIEIRSENDQYGIADRTGKVIVPALYDSFDFNDRTAEAGYVLVKKDDKYAYVSLETGSETSEFVDEQTIYTRSGRFMILDNEDGSKSIVSAAAGRLSEKYKDNAYPGGPLCRLLSVQDQNDAYQIIDENGKNILPAGITIDTLYSIISEDGTMVLLEPEYHHYILLTIAYGAE